MKASERIDGLYEVDELYEALRTKPNPKRYCSRENDVTIGTVRRIRGQLYFAAEIRSGWPFTKDRVYWRACW